MVGSERVRRRPHPALDPPHSAASPAVYGSRSGCGRLEFRDLLKLDQDLVLILRQVAHGPGVGEQLG